MTDDGLRRASGVLEVERGPCGPGGVIGLVDGGVERHHHRVAAEALTNAAKHARASAVNVCVDADDAQLHLSIRDDGIGSADATKESG
jgi:signal transduction histidine kinase